jgi:hypothetical protein
VAGAGRLAGGGEEILGGRGCGREAPGVGPVAARLMTGVCDSRSSGGGVEARGGAIRGGGRVAISGGGRVAAWRSRAPAPCELGDDGRGRDRGGPEAASVVGGRRGGGAALAVGAGVRGAGREGADVGGGAGSDDEADAGGRVGAGGGGAAVDGEAARAASRRSDGTDSSSIQSPRPRRVTSVCRVTRPACKASAISAVVSASSLPSASRTLHPSPPADDGGGLSGADGRGLPASALAPPGARVRSELGR